MAAELWNKYKKKKEAENAAAAAAAAASAASAANINSGAVLSKEDIEELKEFI